MREQIGGGGQLIANHLDQSRTMGIVSWINQKHWVAVRSYLLHSFLQVHSVAAPFFLPAITNREIMLSQKPFH
jgi:hypothetical protein